MRALAVRQARRVRLETTVKPFILLERPGDFDDFEHFQLVTLLDFAVVLQ